MADASFRYQQQSGAGPYFFNQQQNHHPRHIARNGSPVNSSRGPYSNDTPSPSRSPVSHASSHLPFSMYNHNHVQNHGLMLNGGGHQRFQNIGIGHKYQHQNHQPHHGQQNHHHQQNNTLSGTGHQHTLSGTLAHSTPQYPHNINNGHQNYEQLDQNGNYTPHWQQQLQLFNESRQGLREPHRHCREHAAVRLLSKVGSEIHDEVRVEEGGEERNRASVTDVIRRQDWDALDFSGQGLKALSPPVFTQFTFLRRLFLDHNMLQRLDPAVGHLRVLSYLDISGNQITKIPPEIGMLVNLRTLLMFENHVSTFPTEIGHLYKLHMLGIKGNPIEPEIEAHIADHGTQSFIEHMREKLHQPPEPPLREWVSFESNTAQEILSILSYNILCDKYATTTQYGYTPISVLHWGRRRRLILDEIVFQDADVICMQEVDRESFQTYFQYELASKGYKGIFYPKSRAKTMAEAEAKLVDGCAIFYKSKKYICLDKMVVDFGSTAINRQDMKGEHDIFNRVMPRDNISVVGFFENRMTGARFMIGNAHIYWDPLYADVKLVQVAILMEAISKKAEEWARKAACEDKSVYRHSDDESPDGTSESIEEFGPSLQYASGTQIPLILCGDFNSDHASGVYELITQGELSGAHHDLTSRNYGNFTRDGMYHPFKLKSAYNVMGELNFTNYTPNFTGVIDYIWYSHNAMEVRGLLGNVDEQYLRRVPGFPNAHFPSDHLALKAEFGIKPPKAAKSMNGEISTQRQQGIRE